MHHYDSLISQAPAQLSVVCERGEPGNEATSLIYVWTCSLSSVVTRGFLGWAQLMETEMQGWAPIGVVAAIVPWNFPLMLLSWKVCVCSRGEVGVCDHKTSVM